MPTPILPALFTALGLCALGAAPLAAAQGAAAPQTGQAGQAALNELDCRTLLRLSGDERAYTLVYLHGFVSGRTNQLLLPTAEMAEATDRIIDHCIDKPGDKVLPAFEQVRKRR
jgi:hypothetical protein